MSKRTGARDRRPVIVLAAGGYIALLVIVAVAAPWVAPFPIDQPDLQRRLLAPQWPHLLGTDELGRDILSRMMFGARISLGVGAAAVLLAGIVGTAIGLLCALRGGVIDAALMRIGDAQLSIPFILLSMTVIGVAGPSLVNVVIVLGITDWVIFARVARADAGRFRTAPFIVASRQNRVPWRVVIFRHVLPNVRTPILVIAAFEFAMMVFNEAALSFLGLGVQPPTPSWGNMLGAGRMYLHSAAWLTLAPGMALLLLMLSINVIADHVRRMGRGQIA